MDRVLIEKLIDIADTAIEAVEYVYKCLRDNNFADYNDIIVDVENGIAAISRTLMPNKEQFKYSAVFDIGTNIGFSFNCVKEKIDQGQTKEALMILKFQIIPLLKEIKVELYFYGLIFPDRDRMKIYYEKEFVSQNQLDFVKDGVYKYDVSIIVIGYNKLEYTKLCMESILKYTNKGIKFELITINHGSSDGTMEYFNSFSHEKKINLKINMKGKISSLAGRMVEGRYMAVVSNDVIVTENWLDNLLTCMKSDANIAMVVPVTNIIGNCQTMPVTYQSIDEMQSFAARHNVSNPRKWEERLDLWPMLGIVSSEIYNKVGLVDRCFSFLVAADDDISLRFRRNGFKQILAKDTFVHHFGSVTLKDDHKNNGPEMSKISTQLFIDKNGIPPIGNGSCYNPLLIDNLSYNKLEDVTVLGIDAGIGSDPLQIRNIYRDKGNDDVKVYNYITDRRFIDDIKVACDYVVHREDLSEIREVYAGKKFDYIIFSEEIERYDNFMGFIDYIKEMLNFGGQLCFMVKNPFYYRNIYKILNGRLNFENGCCISINYSIDMINRKLQTQKFTNINSLIVKENLNENTSRNIDALSSISDYSNKESIKEHYSAIKYIYIITN
jgi:GT2 family glycosyltransferase